MSLIADLTLLLVAALAGGFVAQRLRQPLMVGYILGGVLVGQFTGTLTVTDAHEIERLAEIGVLLLLFSLGLELSFRELMPVRAVALGGATMQILLTIAFGFGLGRWFGWTWPHALWFGALISLSSTIVALKTLQAQGRLGTLSSRVMLGLLVVQDLAVVPLMIVLPELSVEGAGVRHVAGATLRAAVLLGVVVVVATRLVPPLMALVARWNSREMFQLATTAVALGVGYAAFAFGLSPALGAFIAGLVISESDYAHQALSGVVPLRDLFGMLFFVSVGMLLEPQQVWQNAGTVLVVVTAVVVGKAAILAGVVRAFGYWNVVPLAVGLTLFQVGEFAFVLARVGLSSGAIDHALYSLVLNTAVATMVLTPVVSGLTPVLYGRLRSRRPPEAFEAMNLPEEGLANHVVIAGAGRVGRSIAEALAHLHLPCVIVESNDRRVHAARAAGLPAIYGDASQAVVLDAAEIGRARAMLVTVPVFADVRAIVTSARQRRPDLPIVARADSPEAVQALYALGIQEVASPEFEAGIEMTRQALAHLEVPAHEILRVASLIRHARYGVVTVDEERRALLPALGALTRQLDFTWLRLPDQSPFAGRTIAALQVRSRHGVSIVGLMRGERFVANPDGSEVLQAGDLVAVIGTRDQLARVERAMSEQGVGVNFTS